MHWTGNCRLGAGVDAAFSESVDGKLRVSFLQALEPMAQVFIVYGSQIDSPDRNDNLLTLDFYLDKFIDISYHSKATHTLN